MRTTGSSSTSSRSPRLRRRFARTFSRSRWGEYRRLLAIATGQEYAIAGVENWLLAAAPVGTGPIVLLRHDVDQAPGAALAMAGIEAEFGISSAWYFRWRTAEPRVVESVRNQGHSVGLHYESLTRLALARGLSGSETDALIPEARELLARELDAFAQRFGPCRSACPHGDTRVPGVRNGVLLKGQDPSAYGIECDVNEAIGVRGVDVWLTDRSRAEGGWQAGRDPIDLLIDRRGPLLLVVHPNNWLSGWSLWWDRLVPGGIRTGEDEPPLHDRTSPQSGAPPATGAPASGGRVR